MLKIYTKKGDTGRTSLLNKKNVSKADPVFDVLGNLDELSSSLSLLHSIRDKKIKDILISLQNDLFYLGTCIAGKKVDHDFEKKTLQMENIIDDYQKDLPVLENFIIPGGSSVASYLHISRSICRRLERSLVYYCEMNDMSLSPYIKYVNRMSDLLFVLSRYVNFKLGVKEIKWTYHEN